MADKHPYTSGQAGVVQVVNHLRKSFPAQISAETLKKLGIAPNNESYLINILRFIGVIDEEGKKTKDAGSVFAMHNDDAFGKAFSKLIKGAYADLFALYGDGAWNLSIDDLISYFRGADQTSSIVGRRQATTFQTLAAFSGHGDVPATKPGTSTRRSETKQAPDKKTVKKPKAAAVAGVGNGKSKMNSPDVGLSVRIEIHLPVAPDQETYDRIFKSIRENLLNAV